MQCLHSPPMTFGPQAGTSAGSQTGQPSRQVAWAQWKHARGDIWQSTHPGAHSGIASSHGMHVVGLEDGLLVNGDVLGRDVIGASVGSSEGLTVGCVVTGETVGSSVVGFLVGNSVGGLVGSSVEGLSLGETVGIDVVGESEGELVGISVVGLAVG
jgi:hypothetical protein